MKGARYRSTIFLSGTGKENSLEDALMLLTDAMPGSGSKELIKQFSPHLAQVPPHGVTFSSKRRNRLFTYGCEGFKKVTKFKVWETEDEHVIELHFKTVGGFPMKWVEVLSTSLPDWRLMVSYDSRDDHISSSFFIEAGVIDNHIEDRTFQQVDDVLICQ